MDIYQKKNIYYTFFLKYFTITNWVKKITKVLYSLSNIFFKKRSVLHVIEIFQNNFLEKNVYTVRTPCYFHLKSLIIIIKEHPFETSLETFTKTAIRNHFVFLI